GFFLSRLSSSTRNALSVSYSLLRIFKLNPMVSWESLQFSWIYLITLGLEDWGILVTWVLISLVSSRVVNRSPSGSTLMPISVILWRPLTSRSGLENNIE